MNKLIVLVAATVLSLSAFAGDVKVIWQHPENYRDIVPNDRDNQTEFQANLFKKFEGFFSDLANKLPDDTHWQVVVTDLDLAGDVLPVRRKTGDRLRVLKQQYPPAISFNSTLVDANNKIINEQKVDLTSQNFLTGSLIKRPELMSFPYEEQMLKRWFDLQQKNKVFPSK